MSTHLQPATQEELIELYRRALKQGVSIHELEKKIEKYALRMSVSESIERQNDASRRELLKKQLPAFVRFGALILPAVFITLGLYLVGSAVIPILGYYTTPSEEYSTETLLAPIPHSEVVTAAQATQAFESSLLADARSQVKPEPRIIDEQLDYTNLSNWFGGSELPSLIDNSRLGILSEVDATEYILDIPKLDVENAVVKIGGTDLNESLIAYPGTALPGDFGSPVIFGHSVLRQFYNPSIKNPRRYNSIFSKIMTLKPGDEIFVTYDNITYRYIMNEKTEVKPEDVYILTQRYDSKKLKLVTCVPEGTYLRRGVITAELAGVTQ